MTEKYISSWETTDRGGERNIFPILGGHHPVTTGGKGFHGLGKKVKGTCPYRTQKRARIGIKRLDRIRQKGERGGKNHVSEGGNDCW